MGKLEEIPKYAEHHDFASDMERAVWENDVAPDPMVTTSVRLPKSLLDWLRAQADTQHIRPSALIRQWIEQHREAESGTGDLATRVARLEEAVFHDEQAS